MLPPWDFDCYASSRTTLHLINKVVTGPTCGKLHQLLQANSEIHTSIIARGDIIQRCLRITILIDRLYIIPIIHSDSNSILFLLLAVSIASLQDGRPHIHSHHVYCYDSSLVYLYTVEKLYSYYRMHNITILFHWYQRSSPSTMSQLYMQLSSHTVNVPLWSLVQASIAIN